MVSMLTKEDDLQVANEARQPGEQGGRWMQNAVRSMPLFSFQGIEMGADSGIGVSKVPCPERNG